MSALQNRLSKFVPVVYQPAVEEEERQPQRGYLGTIVESITSLTGNLVKDIGVVAGSISDGPEIAIRAMCKDRRSPEEKRLEERLKQLKMQRQLRQVEVVENGQVENDEEADAMAIARALVVLNRKYGPVAEALIAKFLAEAK